MVDIIGRRFLLASTQAPPTNCTVTTADSIYIVLDIISDTGAPGEDIQGFSIDILNSSNVCVKRFAMSRCCFPPNSTLKPYSPNITLPVGTYTIGRFSVLSDYDCTGVVYTCGSSRLGDVGCNYVFSPSYMKELSIQNLADCTTLTVESAPICTQPSCTMTIV